MSTPGTISSKNDQINTNGGFAGLDTFEELSLLGGHLEESREQQNRRPLEYLLAQALNDINANQVYESESANHLKKQDMTQNYKEGREGTLMSHVQLQQRLDTIGTGETRSTGSLPSIDYFQKLKELTQLQQLAQIQVGVDQSRLAIIHQDHLPSSQVPQWRSVGNAQATIIEEMVHCDSNSYQPILPAAISQPLVEARRAFFDVMLNARAPEQECGEMSCEARIPVKECQDSFFNGGRQTDNQYKESEKEDEEEEEEEEVMGFEEFAFNEGVLKAEEASEQCLLHGQQVASRPSNRTLEVRYVLPRSIRQVEVFLINGEIIVNFEVFKHIDPQHDKVSQWNLFRPLSSITVKKKLVEVGLHKSQGTMSNFQPLIERLMSIQDVKAFASAQLLQKHYASLQDEQLIKQQVQDVYQSHVTHLQWQLEENFHKSKNMAYEIMDRLPEDALFLYSIRRTDPTTMDNIFCALGYSKAFIRLIAGSEQNYAQFCLRSGLAEVFDGQSLLQILLMNLLFSNKVQISITTLDDFTIPCEMRVHYQKLVATEVLPGVFKEDYMKIYHILVDSKNLEEIAILRGTPTALAEIDSQSILKRIVAPDANYTHSATKFVEKFYGDASREKKKKSVNNTMDPFNFTAEFEKLFGGQSEGSNYLDSVFNTKVTPNSSLSLAPRNYATTSPPRNSFATFSPTLNPEGDEFKLPERRQQTTSQGRTLGLGREQQEKEEVESSVRSFPSDHTQSSSPELSSPTKKQKRITKNKTGICSNKPSYFQGK